MCLMGIPRVKKIWTGYLEGYSKTDTALILLAISTILTLVLIAVVSPVTALRYVYNILPFDAIVSVGIMRLVWIHGLEGRGSSIVLLLCTILNLYNGVTVTPLYVENISERSYHTIEEYTALPCVFLNKGYGSYRDRTLPSITKAIPELIEFEEVFVTDDFMGEQTERYLEKKDLENGIILYIGVSDKLDEESCELMIKSISENIKFIPKLLDDLGTFKIYWFYSKD